MTHPIWVYADWVYAFGFGVSWYLISGMIYSRFQFRYTIIAKKLRREDKGFAIVVGSLYALIWPIGLPAVWGLTGFAEFGIWKTFKDEKGQLL